MKTWGFIGAVAVAASLVTAPAMAADLAARPVYKAAPVVAVDAWSPWMIRVRALGVLPNQDRLGTVDQVPTANLRASDVVVPELDITYFFTRNIAAELILGVTKHDLKGRNAISGQDLGSTWLLPPTLTLQYHFTDLGAFKPYVGVGVNYTIPFSEKTGSATTALDVKNAWGFAAQIGFDYMMNANWGINVDVKKLWLDPSYSATLAAGGTAVTGKARLDPWLIGVGLTYRFGGPVVARY